MLIPLVGEEEVKELVAEYDEAIEAARMLADLIAHTELTEEEIRRCCDDSGYQGPRQRL